MNDISDYETTLQFQYGYVVRENISRPGPDRKIVDFMAWPLTDPIIFSPDRTGPKTI